jgi:hypothetical protein
MIRGFDHRDSSQQSCESSHVWLRGPRSYTMISYHADLITHTEPRSSEEGKREHSGLCTACAQMQAICLDWPISALSFAITLAS